MLSLRHTLATGLLCTLPLFNTALSAAIPRQDATPLSSIAIKLNQTSLQARSDLTGAQLIESLVLEAQAATNRSKRSPGIEVLPLITSITPSELNSMVEHATALDPTYEPVDFTTWYQVHLDTPTTSLPSLLESLNLNPEITTCQTLLSTKLPSISKPVKNPLYPSQGHLNPAPEGINAAYAWTFPGGDGTGTSVIDVERGWYLEHEDLQSSNITLLAGMNVRDRYNGNLPHGTAVLGTLLMADNTLGGIGIVPNTKGGVVGIQRTVDSGPRENEPGAILDAARFLQPGDVMLLEMQTTDDSGLLYPIEILDAQFDAIRLATALGIVVIEPAGNGDQGDVSADLDQPFLRYGEDVWRSFLNPESHEFRDSGAIMVGAAGSGVPHRKMPWSNHGKRVDVFSWGENILTSSVVPQDGDRQTYVGFAGTSGATPIVAGAALSLQGIRAAGGRPKLTPAEMRRVIKIEGTPSADLGDRIGVQPDLKAIIDGGLLR